LYNTTICKCGPVAPRGYVSLYAGDASKIAETRIDACIARAFDMWRRSEDVDC
jgi:hypothetical protein